MSAARKTRRRRLAAALLVFCLSVAALDYFAFPYGQMPAGPSVNRGENGLWLHYSWYFGERTAADERAMAERLRANQIRYAYFHARYIGKSGALRFHKREAAQKLTAAGHRDAPGVKVLAYVYVGNTRGLTGVDISNRQTRARMVREAVFLTQTCGFDGIQWDYEICADGDAGLLALLKETRSALAPGKLLSVATPLWVPRPFPRWGWSDDYFSQVAALSDQIAVMGYDSGLYLPRAYVAFMHQQVVHVTRAIAASPNPHCRVLIGVPTYGQAGLSHSQRAETLAFALRGVREGLADPRAAPSVFAGVAPFADHTTTADEWAVYRTLWRN